MNLDQRFRQASGLVRESVRQVEPPSEAAFDRRYRHHRRRRAVVIGLAIAAAVVVAVPLVGSRSGSSTNVDVGPASGRDEPTAGSSTPGDVELTPVDGSPTSRASALLPVQVAPAGHLADGQPVKITGSQFPPSALLVVVVCTNADLAVGSQACDSHTLKQIISSDPSGSFSTYAPLRRFVTVDGAPGHPPRRVDCAGGNVDPDRYGRAVAAGQYFDLGQAGAATCIVGVAQLLPTDGSPQFFDSGVFPVRFDGSPDPSAPIAPPAGR